MTILDAMHDPKLFGPWFKDRVSWRAWEVFLAALFGLPLDGEGAAALYHERTGRTAPPGGPAREAWVVVGRRGGKSAVAALVAVFLGCFRNYSKHLAPGEVGTLPVIAADRQQARTVMRYIVGFLEGVPMLKPLVVSRRKEAIELANRVTIEVHTANFRAVRGYTVVAAIADEVAFWPTDDGSSNPDSEIIGALKPAMATIPNALLMGISSPYARRGVLWDAYHKHFGKDGDPVLVWQAPTAAMNPRVDAGLIADAYADDEAKAAAEYGAEFRRDIESFVSREAVEAVVMPDRRELPPRASVEYVAFVDPSGGSQDSMTLAIAHQEGDHAVLDCVREVKPPFSPHDVVSEFAAVLRSYRCYTVVGDRYGGEWPREKFGDQDIFYKPAGMSKSELYLELLAMINSRRAELLDQQRMIAQLCALERRTARGGRDTVDHPPNQHDDVINAAAGALVLIAKSEGWQSLWLDVGGAETESRRAVSPMIQQVRDAIPILQKKAEDAEYEYPPTCGNCCNKIKDPRSGLWRCKTRLFLIDLNSPGCFAHEFEVDGSMGSGGWSGGSE